MPGLEGRVVAVTGQRRAREMEEMIRRLGGVPYIAPTVNLHFEESREEAERLAREILEGVDWAVFYTGVGVRALFEAAERTGAAGPFLRRLEEARVLSRGRKSLRALRECGRPPDVEADPATTEGVIAALGEADLNGGAVLVQTPGALPSGLREAVEGGGARFRFGSPYTFSPPEDPDAVPGLIRELTGGGIDAATFTSPPAVNNLFAAADELGDADGLVRALSGPVLTASIGPVTSAALREQGVEPALESESQKFGGLLQDVAVALAR
ncbi:MAG: uroporphyrinogen-III synthase [bacterium]